MFIRSILRTFAVTAASALIAGAAFAQGYPNPNRPIKILVGYAAGGGTDTVARLYATKLQELLKAPVIVENKPGAYEAIAAQALLASPPDGYTIWLATTGSLIQAPLIRKMPYDPVKSFTHIGRVGEVDALFAVRKGFPANTVDELIKYAKENPDKVTYGSGGTGAPNHLLGEYIQNLTGTKMTHVPFKNDGDLIMQVASDTVDFAIVTLPLAVPFVNDGRVRAIAVSAPQRLKALPKIPTLEEGSIAQLRGMGVYAFYGIVGPAGMPAEVTKTLSDAFTQIASNTEVVQKFDTMLFRTATSTPAEFRQYIEKESNTWREVAKLIKLE